MVKFKNLKALKNERLKILYIIVILISFLLNLNNFGSDSNIYLDNDKLQLSNKKFYEIQWLENPTFDSPIECWKCNIEGDASDVNATSSQGEANFEVLGDQNSFTFIADPPIASDWNVVLNPEYPSFPDIYEINTLGACVSHYWAEGSDQSVAINWDKNLTMPIDMSDYVVTSAKISVVANGSVETYSDDPPNYSEGIDTANDNCEFFSTGDYARFYVKISDLEKNKEYEIAYYQTYNLGQDSDPEIAYMNDTQLISVPEESLIIFLTSVLNSDNNNFTITIGMRIWCEDNFPQDSDRWNLLIIKSANLTFSYEKKIDKLTSVSWNQIGKKINDLSKYKIEIIDAHINFKCKIDSVWPSSLSPNSEIRILINNMKILETIKFADSNISTFFQDAKLGGFDVKLLIPEEENVSVSIQLYLADDFILDEIITISIDDVVFEISYIEFIPEEDLSTQVFWIVFSTLFAIIGILSALSLRSYVYIPRKKKRENYLILRTQKFKDIRDIRAIILIHRESGLPIFSRSYSLIMKGKKTLFSGFIQAISIIGDEISSEDQKKTKKIKSTEKIDYDKIIELDLKQFFCLVLDVGELRTVLILKSRSSKRLKQIMFNFTLALYLKISKKLENFDNDLTDYPSIVLPFLFEYFELYYKENFVTKHHENDIPNLKKKFKLSKLQIQILNVVFCILSEKRTFRLMDILEKLSEKNEDLIIDAIETLIEYKLILPYDG